MNAFVRVNGRGNAWPVFLGGSSEHYDENNYDELSNASFSLVMPGKSNPKELEWDILIDAGHHTVPFLIKNGNRLPNAVVLTHGHMDHTLGLDWVAQSVYYLSNKQKELPVYATPPVWRFVVQSYPHLERIIDFRPLLPGRTIEINEVSGLSLTAFPVFHGEHAKGASMLMFEHPEIKSVLFTGDMLCPLLRKKDWKKIATCAHVFVDANNRFPYPSSNHGSIARNSPDSKEDASRLIDWYKHANFSYITAPHSRSDFNPDHHGYFEEFKDDFNSTTNLPATIQDFAIKSTIPNIHLVHYGGMEDQKYYRQPILRVSELEFWAQKHIDAQKNNSIIHVPRTGDLISL